MVRLAALLSVLALALPLFAQEADREEFSEDVAGRREWEWLRLCDPATGRIPPNMRKRELSFASTVSAHQSSGSLSKEGLGGLDRVQTSDWTSRGPNNFSGRTRALAVDVTNPKNVLAGGVSGGLWRSTDAGYSWIRSNPITSPLGVSCIAQDRRPGHTSTWYYGTGEDDYYGSNNSAGIGGFFGIYRGDGIFRSTDNGLTWLHLPSTISGTPQTTELFDFVNRIVADSSNGAQDEVYAATYGAIVRSTDGGMSWTVVLGGVAPYSGWTDIAITSSGVLYATLDDQGSSRGIWRSVDGITWTNITPASWPAKYERVLCAVAPSNNSVVYFLGDTPGSGNAYEHSFWKYTYLSGDGTGAGGSWEDRSANLAAISSYGGYCMVLAVKPDDEQVVFAGGINFYRSTDAFATTTHTTNTITTYYSTGGAYDQFHCDHHAVAFSPVNPKVLYLGYDQGINVTSDITRDTIQWVQLSNGYVTSQFYTVAIDHGTPGSATIIGGLQDQGTWATYSSNPLTPWVHHFGGDGCFCAIANGGGWQVVTSEDGLAYRQVVDSAGNVLGQTRIDPTGPNEYSFLTPFVLDPHSTNMMYWTKGDYIWRNSDLTAIPLGSGDQTSVNWTKLANTYSGGIITALSVSNTPANRLYYGTNYGWIFRVDSANVGDPVAVNISTGKGLPPGVVSCIAIDPSNADIAIAVYSNYNIQSVFRTTDAGTSWTPIGGNLEQYPDGTGDGPSCRWLSILTVLDTVNVYILATSTGVYATAHLNGMSTWWVEEGTSSIGHCVVDMIDVRSSDGFVVAATHGNGVFSTTMTTVSVPESGPAGTPARFALAQNYPNPFNPTSTIRYQISDIGYVKLSVFDILGREVATLVNEQKRPGSYEVTFNASGLASGVYLYRLTAGSFVQTRKMTFIR